MSQQVQKFIRKEKFPIFGNLSLIDALRKLGVDVRVDFHAEEALAIFDYDQTEEYECLKRILARHQLVASA